MLGVVLALCTQLKVRTGPKWPLGSLNGLAGWMEEIERQMGNDNRLQLRI